MPSESASWASDSGCSRPVPDGPPTTGTTSRDRSDGSRSSRERTACSSTSGRLQRLDAAGEHQHHRVLRAGRAAARAEVERTEDVEVDAGVHDLDAGRVGVVELEQLLGLDVGVRDQHVGGLDDLLLADHPRRRLGGVPDGQRGVLDLGHRVHRVHQRHAPPVADQGADLAGEPVVRVHDVVPALVVAGLGPQHLAGEHAQLAGELALGEALERAGVHVVDGDAGERLDGRRQRRRGGARVDLDGDVAGGEPLGELDDVDVHAARVAGAGLVQRRRVHADHRDPAVARAGGGLVVAVRTHGHTSMSPTRGASHVFRTGRARQRAARRPRTGASAGGVVPVRGARRGPADGQHHQAADQDRERGVGEGVDEREPDAVAEQRRWPRRPPRAATPAPGRPGSSRPRPGRAGTRPGRGRTRPDSRPDPSRGPRPTTQTRPPRTAAPPPHGSRSWSRVCRVAAICPVGREVVRTGGRVHGARRGSGRISSCPPRPPS